MRETININGVFYDAKTGLPVEPDKPKLDTPKKTSKPKKITIRAPKKIAVSEASKPKSAKPAHKPAPSRTLNRRFVAKPLVKVARQKPIRPAPRPVNKPNLEPTISTRPSPIVARGTRRPTPKLVQPEPIKDVMSVEEKRNTKLISIIISAVALIVIIASVLAYFFVPSVSFWMATSRAEVSSSMPTYSPAGFDVDGRVQSSPGIVHVNYKSPNGAYSISMANSNWDSKGVLENKVKPASANYQTLEQKGLTIFTYKNTAMWVNGGILYTISYDTEFSNDEILKIVDGI